MKGCTLLGSIYGMIWIIYDFRIATFILLTIIAVISLYNLITEPIE